MDLPIFRSNIDMNAAEVKKRIEQLSREIEDHNYKYYVLSQPTISDKEYDDLLKQLIKLESDFPQFKDINSPSQRIGAKVESSETVTHQAKMYSLDNTYSVEELKEWYERVLKGLNQRLPELVVELKIDGVSSALTYSRGQMVMGATRGDGIRGENVTHSLKTVGSIPLKLRKMPGAEWPEVLEVRGEVYMKRKDFDRMNQQREKDGEELFANPRNATSGSVKLLDSRLTRARHLNFFVHSFGVLASDVKIESQWEFLKRATEWGFAVNPNNRLCQSIDDVIAFYNEFQERRAALDYEVDGVVIKVNSFRDQKQLGETLKSPRWAVAFKFKAIQATTVVEHITFQVGRTGVITPVAELRPVECGGVTVSRSTLHNFDEVKRLGVKKGDRVLIERAGDVIPKIIKVVESSRKSPAIQIPKKCPSCQSAIVKLKEEEVAYRCINPSCPKQLERKLVHFASRGAMDIEGLGEVVAVQLIEKKWVNDLADIYALNKVNLLTLQYFKDKKADNLLQAIEKSKTQPLSRFLLGLGIINVGEKVASVLAKKYQSLDHVMKAQQEELCGIHEIGETIAQSVESYFKAPQTRKLMERFKKLGLNLKEPESPSGQGKFLGKKFVFTGELMNRTRAEAGQLVRAQGAEVLNTISKNVDYLVVGNAPGSKLTKAKKLGVTILNEEQFEKLIHI